MFLTPPDVISQTLLALPMWVLFEFGVFFSTMFAKRKKDEDSPDEQETTEGTDDRTPADIVESTENTIHQEAESTEQSTGQSTEPSVSGAKAAAATSSMTATEQLAANYPDDFTPMTDEEMEAELDRLDDEDDEDDDIYNDYDDHSGDGGQEASGDDPVDIKLAQVMEYRDENNLKAARALLYEVLEEGDDSQITVARNILAQLDSDD